MSEHDPHHLAATLSLPITGPEALAPPTLTEARYTHPGLPTEPVLPPDQLSDRILLSIPVEIPEPAPAVPAGPVHIVHNRKDATALTGPKAKATVNFGLARTAPSMPLVERDSWRDVLGMKYRTGKLKERQAAEARARQEHITHARASLYEKNEANAASELRIKTELTGWDFTEAPADNEQPERIAQELVTWGQQIAEMSVYNVNRAADLRSYNIANVRFAQRQARIAAQTDTVDEKTPMISPDRSVVMMDTNGKSIMLHEDGSMTTEESSGMVRRNTDGSIWHAPAPTTQPIPQAYKDRKSTSPERLAEIASDSFAQWEETRTPSDAHAATLMARASTEAFDLKEIPAALVYHKQVTQVYRALNRLTDLQNTHQALMGDIDGAVRRLVAGDKGTFDPENKAAIDAARASVDNRIARLEQAVQSARQTAEIHAAAAQDLRNKWFEARALSNKSRYGLALLAATDSEAADGRKVRKDEAGRPTESSAAVQTDGSVLYRSTVMNGKKGNWQIFQDGSSQLHGADDIAVATFSVSGELLEGDASYGTKHGEPRTLGGARKGVRRLSIPKPSLDSVKPLAGKVSAKSRVLTLHERANEYERRSRISSDSSEKRAKNESRAGKLRARAGRIAARNLLS